MRRALATAAAFLLLTASPAFAGGPPDPTDGLSELVGAMTLPSVSLRAEAHAAAAHATGQVARLARQLVPASPEMAPTIVASAARR